MEYSCHRRSIQVLAGYSQRPFNCTALHMRLHIAPEQGKYTLGGRHGNEACHTTASDAPGHERGHERRNRHKKSNKRRKQRARDRKGLSGSKIFKIFSRPLSTPPRPHRSRYAKRAASPKQPIRGPTHETKVTRAYRPRWRPTRSVIRRSSECCFSGYAI